MRGCISYLSSLLFSCNWLLCIRGKALQHLEAGGYAGLEEVRSEISDWISGLDEGELGGDWPAVSPEDANTAQQEVGGRERHLL